MPKFTVENWNPAEWMQLARDAGATYVILTTKHHDGYCLWDTKTTDKNSVQTGPRRDLLRDFMTAAREAGLQFGIYYSWSEFSSPSVTVSYCRTVIVPQISELQKYEPDIWWFDGHWAIKTQYAKKAISDIVQGLGDAVLINDRSPTPGTYKVYEDRYLPKERPPGPWEHINTIGLSWGANRAAPANSYKSGKELYTLWRKVSAMDGRFLLNVGPLADGSLLEEERKSLLEFGQLNKGASAPL